MEEIYMRKLGIKKLEESNKLYRAINNLDYLTPKERNSTCYFCGFKEYIHKHHIIRKVDGGNQFKNNVIPLCPNHHYLIHGGIYFVYYLHGYYFLINKGDNRKFIIPHSNHIG